MKKTFVVLALIVVIVPVTLFFVSPTWRTNATSAVESLTQWTPEAIEKNPIAYSQFVEAQLKKDQKTFQETRKKLAISMEGLAKKLAAKTKLLEQGEKLAEEFAETITAGSFPVTLHGKEYTESQLRMQLALTLAQINGLKESVTEITKVSAVAEKELQKLVVGIEKTESQISLLATRREIFRSQATSAEGLAMIAGVNAVLEGNQLLVKSNPVRTIEEILNDAESSTQEVAASDVQVEEYLQSVIAKKSQKGDLFQTKDIPLAPGDEK
jgi:hypothetical protein